MQEHLDKHVSICDLSKIYEPNTNVIYHRRKQVIGNVPANLSKAEHKRAEKRLQDYERRIKRTIRNSR
ncbi:MAG: hypothetical protein WC313_07845 [Candidatus Kapaibacterium sp.]